MKFHRIAFSVVFGSMLLVCAESNGASINGLKENPRVFNDFPGSTLTITNSNSVNPGSVNIDDRLFGAGGFANRHDVVLSSDGGVSGHVFGIDDTFTVKAEVTLDVGFNAPRKEVGLRLNSGIGDALFLINSDAGEIVAFGGPFHLFGSNGGGNGYTPGDTILMGITYTGGGDGVGGVPSTIEYFIDRGLGIESSGALPFTNLEGGYPAFEVAFFGQTQVADNSDFMTADFSNIMFTMIPEPSTYTLALLCVVGVTRRRSLKALQ